LLCGGSTVFSPKDCVHVGVVFREAGGGHHGAAPSPADLSADKLSSNFSRESFFL
jgi:hypothetical protein